MYCSFLRLDCTKTIFKVSELLWKGNAVKNHIILKCRYHNKIKFFRNMNLFLVQNEILLFNVLFKHCLFRLGMCWNVSGCRLPKKYYGELESGRGLRKSFWQFWSDCMLTSNGIFVLMLGTNRPAENSITNKELWMFY